MKKSIISFAFMLFSMMSFAQEGTDLQWFTNMENAKEYAQAQEHHILIVFSGSDWCRPCIQFKQDILEDKDFQEWGSDKLVILYLDFPSKKKNRLSPEAKAHNEALAEKYNKSGAFPNILLINKQEELLTDLKFENQSVEDFIREIPVP